MVLGIVAGVGIFLSSYMIWVKYQFNNSENYLAMCDFRKNVSCTRVFSSKYEKLFGVSNAIVGLAFYIITAVLAFFSLYTVIFILSIVAVLMSAFLAYQLYKLKNMCVVCVGTYIVNIMVLVVSSVKVF